MKGHSTPANIEQAARMAEEYLRLDEQQHGSMMHGPHASKKKHEHYGKKRGKGERM